MANRVDYGVLESVTIDALDGTHAAPEITFNGPFAETGNTHPVSTDKTQGMSDGQQAKFGSEASYDIGINEYDPAHITTIRGYSALPSTHKKSVRFNYSSGASVTCNGSRPMVDTPAPQDDGSFAPIRLKGSNVVFGPTADAAPVSYS